MSLKLGKVLSIWSTQSLHAWPAFALSGALQPKAQITSQEYRQKKILQRLRSAFSPSNMALDTRPTPESILILSGEGFDFLTRLAGDRCLLMVSGATFGCQ